MAKAAAKPAAKKRANGKKGKPGAKRQYDRAKIVARICDGLLDGKPMALICREIGIPVRTVNQWREDDEAIANRFDEAFDAGMDTIAYDCIIIADTPQEGVETVNKADGGIEVRKGDMLGHRKLRVETRLKLLANWHTRYSRRVTLAGDPKSPLLPPPTQLTEAQLLAIAAQGIKDDGTDG